MTEFFNFYFIPLLIICGIFVNLLISFFKIKKPNIVIKEVKLLKNNIEPKNGFKGFAFQIYLLNKGDRMADSIFLGKEINSDIISSEYSNILFEYVTPFQKLEPMEATIFPQNPSFDKIILKLTINWKCEELKIKKNFKKIQYVIFTNVGKDISENKILLTWSNHPIYKINEYIEYPKSLWKKYTLFRKIEDDME